MSVCRLCNEERVLRNSHIVSEFLYDDLYNDKHQVVGIDGVGKRGRKLLQKGIREPLLCESCEQHINEYCEKPFRAQWLESSPLPVKWDAEDLFVGRFEYSSFKLFHLSILFRCGVSTLPTYKEVSLGPHQERIRKMLLARDPGSPSVYPIFGYAVVHHQTRCLVRFISAPEKIKFHEHRCYGMIFGGVYWCYGVSSHRNRDLERTALRADGQMPFHAVPWNEVGIVQNAKEFLVGGTRL